MMATLEWMRARGTSTAQLAEAEAEVTAAAQATQVAADALANARAQVTLRHAELLTWTLHCVTREHMVEEHAKAEAGLQQAHAKQDEAQARMNRAALKLDRAAQLENAAQASAAAGQEDELLGAPVLPAAGQEDALSRLRLEAMLSINGPLSIDAVGGSADGVHPRGFDALMSIDVGLLVLRAVQPVLALRAAEQQELAGGAQVRENFSAIQNKKKRKTIQASVELLAQARSACEHSAVLFGEAVKDELLAVLFDEADKELRAQWETNSRRLAAASAEETNGRRLAAASADLPDNDPGTPALLRSTSWDKELRAQWKTNSRRLAAASADQRDDVDLELQKGLELSLDAARLPTGAVQEDALRNYELFHQLKRGSATHAQVAASSAGIDGWAMSPPDEGEEGAAEGEPEDRRRPLRV